MYWLSLYLIVVGLAASWLAWRWKHARLIKMAQEVPGPYPVPLIGNAYLFFCKPVEMIKVIKKLITDFGDVVTFWLGPDLNYIISHPEDLKTLLLLPKTSIKGPQYKFMAEVLGGGILSGSGAKWRKHRKIASPNYGKRAIRSYSNTFNSEADLLMEKLKSVGPIKIDIYKFIVQTTSHSVCQTLMGLTKEQTTNLPYLDEIIKETPRLYDIVFDRMTKWYLQIDPVFWMTNFYQQQKNFIKMLTVFSQQVIKHRVDQLYTLEDKEVLMNTEEDSIKNTYLSVIDRFILSKEFDQHDLVKETFTVFTSSQEATAKISSFIIAMMAYHPKCQQRLYEEIKSVLGDEDKPVIEDDFKKMPYLDMVFKEVLRLFPIGVMLQRTVSEDIKISTCTLPAGSSFVVPIFHLHRDPRFWERPDAFDPERFTLENIKKRNPNCYLPFSLGPMDCLGRYFGTNLVKTIAVKILREFYVTSPETYDDMRVIMAVSAVSLNGYPIFLHRRIKKVNN